MFFFLESDNYVENIDMFQELDTFIESVYTYDMQTKDLMIECIREEYNSTLNESASDIWEAVKKFFKRIWQFCKDLLAKVKNFFGKLFRRNNNTVNEIKKTEQEITKIESEIKQTLKDSSNKTKELSQRLDNVKSKISSASSTTKPSATKNDEKLERTKYEKYGNPNVKSKSEPISAEVPWETKMRGRMYNGKNGTQSITFNLNIGKDGNFYFSYRFKESINCISRGTSIKGINDHLSLNDLLKSYDKLIAYGKSIKNLGSSQERDRLETIAGSTTDFIEELTSTREKLNFDLITVKDLKILRVNFHKLDSEIKNRFKPYEGAINQLKMFAEEGLKEAESKTIDIDDKVKKRKIRRKKMIVEDLTYIVSKLNKLNSASAKVMALLNEDLVRASNLFGKEVRKYHKIIKEYK